MPNRCRNRCRQKCRFFILISVEKITTTKGECEMIIEETISKMKQLKFFGMLRAFENQIEQPQTATLSFEERLGLLVDQEWTFRDNRKTELRLRRARLRIQEACVEKIDYAIPGRLNKNVLLRLTTSDWIAKHQNVIITGPTGIGKSFIACALAQKACRDGYVCLYKRLSRLLYDLSIAHADGSYGKELLKLSKIMVLVLDDFLMSPLNNTESRFLLEILEDRYNCASTIVATQIPRKKWHENIPDPTLADAICDRLIHNAHKIDLKGDSVRKLKDKVD